MSSSLPSSEVPLPTSPEWPHALLEAVDAATAITDLAGRVQAANSQFHRLIGWTSAAAQGQGLEALLGQPSSEPAQWVSALRRHEDCSRLPVCGQRADGSALIASINVRRHDHALVVTLSELVSDDPHAGSRREAALACRHQPTLVLLDMPLPDIDGLQVLRSLRSLRQDPRTAALRCVALSANAMPGDIDAAIAAGFDAHWTKPLDFNGFQAALSDQFGPAPVP